MIIKKFRECGATSEKSAKTLEEAGVVNYNAFQNIIDDLLNQNKLVKTKSGKYYLNVKKWSSISKDLHYSTKSLLAIILTGILIFDIITI